MADDIGFGNRPLPDMHPGAPRRDTATGKAFFPNSPTPREQAVKGDAEDVNQSEGKAGAPKV
jgi:hypothetical protein